MDKFLKDNDRFVWHIVRKFKSTAYAIGIDYQDLHSIAQFGMLKAYQSFDEDKGAKWPTHAAVCMGNEIKIEIRRRNRAPKTISMDAPLSEDESGHSLTLADLAVGDRDIDIGESMFFDFANQLDGRDREVIARRLNGQKQHEIARELDLSQSYLSRILQRIYNEYTKGEWHMGRTIQGDIQAARSLLETTTKNNMEISKETGVSANRVRLLRHDTHKHSKKDTQRVDEPNVVVVEERREPQQPNMINRITALRTKLSECLQELADIETEVRPLLSKRNELSEAAKKIMDLVG